VADLLIPRLVGLAGYAGSGKDTAADVLEGLGYQRRAFAGALKDLATRIGWDGRKDDAGRQLLQELGVGCREVLGADVWVQALMSTLTGPSVIVDVRFPNEVDAIADHGGIVLRIVRPSVGPCRNHVSETALDDVDLPVVVNDGDVVDLHARVLAVLAACPATP